MTDDAAELGWRMNDDAAELGRLRRWAHHPRNVDLPLARAVRMLFRRAAAQAEKIASAEAAVVDAEQAQAALITWRAKAVRLQGDLNALRRAPWEDNGEIPD